MDRLVNIIAKRTNTTSYTRTLFATAIVSTKVLSS